MDKKIMKNGIPYPTVGSPEYNIVLSENEMYIILQSMFLMIYNNEEIEGTTKLFNSLLYRYKSKLRDYKSVDIR